MKIQVSWTEKIDELNQDVIIVRIEKDECHEFIQKLKRKLTEGEIESYIVKSQ